MSQACKLLLEKIKKENHEGSHDVSSSLVFTSQNYTEDDIAYCLDELASLPDLQKSKESELYLINSDIRNFNNNTLFAHLSKTLSKNPNIKKLTLNYFTFKEKDRKAFQMLWNTNCGLESITFTKCELGNHDEGLQPILLSLGNVGSKSKISQLFFNYQKLSEHHLKLIQELVKTNKNITDVDFNKLFFYNDDFLDLYPAQCYDLRKEIDFYLMMNRLRAIVLQTRSNTNKKSVVEFIRMCVSNMEMEGFKEYFEKVLQEFCLALKNNTKITSIDFGMDYSPISHLLPFLSEQSCEFLFQSLLTNNTVTNLVLVIKTLTPRICELLTAVLTKSSLSLTDISLRCKEFNPKVELDLARIMNANKSLKVLNLSNCGIRQQNCAEFYTALKEHPSCTRLSLKQCNLGHDAGVAIAQALKTNTHLVFLHLYKNNYSLQTGKELIRGLKENRTIRWATFDDQEFGEKEGQEILELLDFNHTIEVVGNKFTKWNDSTSISKITMDEILYRLKKNKSLFYILLENLRNNNYKNGNLHLDSNSHYFDKKMLMEILMALEENQQITTLSFENIDLDTLNILCVTLTKNYTLAYIDFGNNEFSEQHLQVLKRMLMKNTTIYKIVYKLPHFFKSASTEKLDKEINEMLERNKYSFQRNSREAFLLSMDKTLHKDRLYDRNLYKIIFSFAGCALDKSFAAKLEKSSMNMMDIMPTLMSDDGGAVAMQQDSAVLTNSKSNPDPNPNQNPMWNDDMLDDSDVLYSSSSDSSSNSVSTKGQRKEKGKGNGNGWNGNGGNGKEKEITHEKMQLEDCDIFASEILPEPIQRMSSGSFSNALVSNASIEPSVLYQMKRYMAVPTNSSDSNKAQQVDKQDKQSFFQFENKHMVETKLTQESNQSFSNQVIQPNSISKPKTKPKLKGRKRKEPEKVTPRGYNHLDKANTDHSTPSDPSDRPSKIQRLS